MTKKSKLFFVMLLLVLVGGLLVWIGSKDEQAQDEWSQAEMQKSLSAIEAYMNSGQKETHYYSVKQQWDEAGIAAPDVNILVTATQIEGGTLLSNAQSHDYGSEVVLIDPQSEISFTFDAPRAGLYELWLDYYILEPTYTNPEISILLNGESQFNEMNRLLLPMEWQPKHQGLAFDRYGDELTPKSELLSSWKSVGLGDPNHFFTEPLKFQLKEGTNQISIRNNEGYVLIGNIQVKNTVRSLLSYEEYRSQLKEKSSAQHQLVTIEAEDMSVKSRQSIRAKYMRDPQVTPYAYKNRVLNVLDGYSFGDSGDKVTYRFSIEESGWYQLTLK